MRITVVISSVLLVQTSASLFSELSSSLSSVGSSVGKLISDVASDVKDTLDCTYAAALIAYSGDTAVPDYYNDKCQTQKPTNVAPLPTLEPIRIYIGLPANPVHETNQPTREQTDLKTIPNVNVNDKTVKEMESVLIEETRTLANMSSMLHHEFEDLSKHVNENLEEIEYEQKLLSMDKVMKEIDKLQEEEITYRNKMEIEIRDLFAELLSKLEKNETGQFEFKKEIDSAIAAFKQHNNITGVEQELEKWKVEEIKSITELRDILKKMSNNTSTTTEKVSRAAPTTVVVSTLKPTTTTKTVAKIPKEYDYLVAKDKKSLDKAKNLIMESRRKSLMMDAILKNYRHASNAFDHPNLLGR